MSLLGGTLAVELWKTALGSAAEGQPMHAHHHLKDILARAPSGRTVYITPCITPTSYLHSSDTHTPVAGIHILPYYQNDLPMFIDDDYDSITPPA